MNGKNQYQIKNDKVIMKEFEIKECLICKQYILEDNM